MAHLSLYRAFRPRTFEEMVRQEHVVRILKNQIEGDAVGHAYLFCGPRGTGKTTVARIFARAVNCERPVNGSPCGVCKTCRALEEGGNLDVSEIDAASNNGVNEMRDLREKVQYPPVSGKYKVYIVDEVHMLTDSAFNALLKTLEEPPRHAIFILATTEPQKIPATILSRCMRMDFKLIPQSDLEGHLKRVLKEIGKDFEEEAVAAIARAGAGSDRDMLSIAEMCVSYEDKLTYKGVTAVLGSADFLSVCELCKYILTADRGNALSAAEKILGEGKSVGVLLKDIMQFLNQAAIAKSCRNGEEILCLPKEVFAGIAAVAKEADGHALFRATEIFAKAESDLRFSSNPRICLETAIVKASMPQADANLDALLARISSLEKQVEELKEKGIAVVASPAAPPPLSEKEPLESKGGQPEERVQRTEYSPAMDEIPFDDAPFDPPMEEPPEESFFFPVAEEKREEKKPQARREAEKPPVQKPSAEKPSVSEPAPRVSAGQTEKSAEVVFGTFIRKLRKTSRNGVLFTMCSDLEAAFEGDLLALYTESRTIYNSLREDRHRETMAAVFSEIGVEDFAVRLKGSKEQEKEDKQKAIDRLKADFGDYPVEIK